MEPSPSPPMDRRAFLQRLAAAAAASALAPAASLAQAAPAPAPTPPPASPAPASAPTEPSEDARALTAMLRRRFEGRLTDEQWAAVGRDFESDLAAGRRLRAFALGNADEPDSVFRA